MTVLPTIFVSHGAPDVAIAKTEASDFLRALGTGMPRPSAIVVASAHFEAQGQVLATSDSRPATIHDFGGFDRRLYDIRYDAPGDPDLAETIVEFLAAEGFAAQVVTDRGFDHGTWVPLSLTYPEADIPVVQVSVDPTKGAEHHFALGQALAPLRGQGILIIGSGCFTHNLVEAFGHVRAGERDAPTPDWVAEFSSWMAERIIEGDHEALLAYRDRAPFARENHPNDEHLMPLYVAMGAAGEGTTARRLHDSRDFGVLSMAAFAFA